MSNYDVICQPELDEIGEKFRHTSKRAFLLQQFGVSFKSLPCSCAEMSTKMWFSVFSVTLTLTFHLDPPKTNQREIGPFVFDAEKLVTIG